MNAAATSASAHPRAGFTLIEMLVVMCILATLAALAYPSYARHVVRSRRTEGQIALIEAMQQQERYRMQHNRYLAYSAEAGTEDAQAAGLRWWSGQTAAASAYELDAYACTGQDIADCVELRARPGTARVDGRFRDVECAALTLDSVGNHGPQGRTRCWP